MQPLNITVAPPFNLVNAHEIVTGDGKRLVYIRGYRHVAQDSRGEQTVIDYVTVNGRYVEWAEAYPVGFHFAYSGHDNHIRRIRIDSWIKLVHNRPPEFGGGEFHGNIELESTYDMVDDDVNPAQAAVAVIIVALTREP